MGCRCGPHRPVNLSDAQTEVNCAPMLSRLRRFLDVRPGEGLPVLLTFSYIASVVAAFLLAKPIRNSLFLRQYGPYAIAYVYVTVPLVLSIFVPAYTRVAARLGSRTVTVGTLLFFTTNVLLFWYLLRFHRFWLLPGMFYVWVNCFAVIAPVQAWTFANSLFDTRQARRLFGLLGSSASLGAIAGGVLARFLVGPVGGTVNMLLVLAALILGAAGIVTVANAVIPRTSPARRGRPVTRPFLETAREIAHSPYLRLIGALLFLVAVVTQWAGFQLNIVADRRFGGDADALTRFFGTFNFVLGAFSFVLQMVVTRRLLRNFGVAVTILTLPIALGLGSALVVLVPGFVSVIFMNALDQGLRFSVDKATYELLYLPIPLAQRFRLKSAIDILVNRVADAVGGILFGIATRGFLMIDGFQLGLRGTAAINLGLIGVWGAVAWRLRREYVRTIQDSIHRHRLDTERASASILDRSAADALTTKLQADDPAEVRYALSLLEAQQKQDWQPALRDLLSHPEADIRRRVLSMLSGAGDRHIADRVSVMLRDPDLGVRTEALLYLSREIGIDPLQRIQEIGEFEDYSIRAGMAAFLASPGRSQNVEAAHAILDGMVRQRGPEGVRDRLEAARVIALNPESFPDLVEILLRDENDDVARQSVRSADALVSPMLVPALVSLLARPAVADVAGAALARFGDTIVPMLGQRLRDAASSLELRREIPGVLVRIGSPAAVEVLLDSLLQSDATVRHRVIASLNKLEVRHPGVRLDRGVIELLLAAEIAGHYRSYQVLGPLLAQFRHNDPGVEMMRQTMDQELERIFRLMALLLPEGGLHDAYIGLRSSSPMVRANALEFLDNVLKPELRQVLVPLLDAQVTTEERIALANRIVGAPLENAEQAVATLLASEDPWLRSSGVYAVGALQLHGLAEQLLKFEDSSDPALRDSVRAARQRLATEADTQEIHEPAPPGMTIGVGAG
jgi:AAA family ATP:ADP antiporter